MLTEPPRAIVFSPMYNAEGKRDVTGAFRPGARLFAFEYGRGRTIEIDNRQPLKRRRQAVLDALYGHQEGCEGVAFFCHGWATGIQLGFRKQHCPELAEALAEVCSSDRLAIPLYACSTADTNTGAPGGDGGFADTLRDALCREGVDHCHVDAHDTVGHAFRNPRVRRFSGDGSPVGGSGGSWIVRPGSELWPAWRRAVRGDLWHRFPWMSVAEVHAELSAD